MSLAQGHLASVTGGLCLSKMHTSEFQLLRPSSVTLVGSWQTRLVKMSSARRSEGSYSFMPGVLIRRGNLATDTTQGGHPLKMKAGIGVTRPQATECQRLPANPRRWERGLSRFSLRSLRGNQCPDLGLPAFQTVRNKSLLLRPQRVALCYGGSDSW